ncbi:MAG: hypothetical protein PUC64_00250 [Clostridium sp.]|nr:hypothetical protein [Clostridium sp.]
MEIISSIIESCGVIIGALIAGGYISSAFKRYAIPLFHTYSDGDHNVCNLLRKAQNNIYFVMSIGDKFLSKYEQQLRIYLNRRIKVNILIHSENEYYKFENYICDDSCSYDFPSIRKETLAKLRKLATDYPELVEVREFSSFFAASYIGIDIEQDVLTGQWPSHSMLQMMVYQYKVNCANSPISVLSIRSNRDLFISTANCILNMWDAGSRIQID